MAELGGLSTTKIIVRNLDLATANELFVGDDCLTVDLTGGIDIDSHSSDSKKRLLFPFDAKTDSYRPPENIHAGMSVLLSVKNFPDSPESSRLVFNVVDGIVTTSRACAPRTIAINCHMGKMRAPLIACRLMAVLEGHPNTPGPIVYTKYKSLCERFIGGTWLHVKDEPKRWPKLCNNWTNEQIMIFKRGERKYPTAAEGQSISRYPHIEFEVEKSIVQYTSKQNDDDDDDSDSNS